MMARWQAWHNPGCGHSRLTQHTGWQHANGHPLKHSTACPEFLLIVCQASWDGTCHAPNCRHRSQELPVKSWHLGLYGRLAAAVAVAAGELCEARFPGACVARLALLIQPVLAVRVPVELGCWLVLLARPASQC